MLLLKFNAETERVLWALGLIIGLGGCMQFNRIPYLGEPSEMTSAGATTIVNTDTSNKNLSLRLGELATDTPKPVKFSEFDIDTSSDTGILQFQQEDIIDVRIWNHSELSHTAMVQPNGMITLPLIGEIQAEGMTVPKLRQAITARFKAFSQPQSEGFQYGDVLTLLVWQHENLNYSTTIQPNGKATFPLAGEIDVVGRGNEEIRQQVEGKIRRYIRDAQISIIPKHKDRLAILNPQVSILPKQLRPRMVAIIGEINIQGRIPIRNGMRVIEAIAHSQYKITSELNSVVVIRNYQSEYPQYRRLRLASFLSGSAPDQNILLKDNDIIIVPKMFIAKIGDFIDHFFTRTRPVFDWWVALHQARFAEALGKSSERLNNLLFQNN